MVIMKKPNVYFVDKSPRDTKNLDKECKCSRCGGNIRSVYCLCSENGSIIWDRSACVCDRNHRLVTVGAVRCYRGDVNDFDYGDTGNYVSTKMDK